MVCAVAHVHQATFAHPDCGRRQILLPDGRTDGRGTISAVAAITSIQITLSKAAAAAVRLLLSLILFIFLVQ